jgi:predicted Zn finger-like uncharacterized protein
MPSSFACPECNAVLKTKADIPAGKKVKCPKCATIFAAPEPEEEPVRTAARAAAATNVRSGKPPAVTARRSAPAVEDDEEEDRPRKKSKKGKKKKKQNNNMPLLIGLGGGGALLIGLVLFLGFVSPGFFKGKEKTRAKSGGAEPVAAAKVDLLAFVPPGFTFFEGVDLAELDQHQFLKPKLHQMLSAKTEMLVPPGLADSLAADRILFAANFDVPEGTEKPDFVWIARLRNASTAEQVTQTLQQISQRQSSPEQVDGKTIYKLTSKPGAAKIGFFHMPKDNVVIFGGTVQQRIASLLTTGSDLAVSAQAQTEVRDVEERPYWVAMEIGPALKKQLNGLDMMAGFVPDLKPLVTPMKNIKSMKFSAEAIPSNKLKLQMTATFENPADSEQIREAVQKSWDTKGKTVQLKPGPLTTLLQDVISSFTLTSKGPQLTMLLEFSEEPLSQLTPQSVMQTMMELQGAAGGQAAPPTPPQAQPPAQTPEVQPMPPPNPQNPPGGRKPGPPGGRPPRKSGSPAG